MAKKKVQMKNLGKQHVKDMLRKVHPFLSKPYRDLELKETKSETVFKELFGEDVPVELYKLKAIYEFQK